MFKKIILICLTLNLFSTLNCHIVIYSISNSLDEPLDVELIFNSKPDEYKKFSLKANEYKIITLGNSKFNNDENFLVVSSKTYGKQEARLPGLKIKNIIDLGSRDIEIKSFNVRKNDQIVPILVPIVKTFDVKILFALHGS